MERKGGKMPLLETLEITNREFRGPSIELVYFALFYKRAFLVILVNIVMPLIERKQVVKRVKRAIRREQLQQ